ncbi:MAG: hypothetical protein ABSD64_08080 [Terriglobales bacterium]|jgi:hypothetical protein
MSTTPPNPPTPGGAAPAPLPTPQKSSGVTILLWVLGIIVGLTLLSFGSCAVIGFYALHKVKQAGFDSELMKKNPGLATAKMAVTLNPDTEIISSDDSAGTIVVRDKKTGKVVTMKFDPQKKAMEITDENGKTSTMTTSGDGSSANLEIKGPDGTVKIGNNSDKPPDWVPAYPGSSPKSTFSASNGGEQTGSYAFITADSPDKLIAFYGDALKSGGFAVSNMSSSSDGKVGGMVSGEDKANKRTVVVGFNTESDGTHVNVTFSVKP